MKKILFVLLFSGLMISFQPPFEDSPVRDNPIKEYSADEEKNPLYNDFNQPIDFAAINADHIKSATISIQEKVNAQIEKLVSIPDQERTYENTLLALDDLAATLSDVNNKIYLLSSTHADSLIRNTALESRVTLSKFGNEISLNEDLYKAVKSFSTTDEAKSLQGYKAKYLKETIESYERNGFALSQEKREVLKTIRDEMSKYSNQFSQNISTFTEEGVLEGLHREAGNRQTVQSA